MKKILIVADMQTAGNIADVIPSVQYDTVCAYSEAEALEAYDKERPDLVLCAFALPQSSGLKLQRLLSDRCGELIPIVFFSDGTNADAENLAFAAGAMDYIAYPFKPDVLMHRIDNAMRQVESIQQLQGLKVVAETDPMTGLLNKVSTEKTVSALCARASGTIMMVDLDDFKLVNDLHGHDAGDRVIILFADILRGVIRSGDIVGRVGGDEFLIFCRDIRSEQLIAQKTKAINDGLVAAAKVCIGEDMNIPLGASVGAVVVPDAGRDFAELYKKADKALYTAKQNGKHGYAFFREQGAQNAAEVSHASSSSLSAARAILVERTRQKGAYEVKFEHFRSIARFAMRQLENYHYDAEFLLFSFDVDIDDDKVDTFGALLRQALRRSDIYTKSSRTQFMVLLPHTGSRGAEIAIERVMRSWRQLDRTTEIACEHEALLADDA